MTLVIEPELGIPFSPDVPYIDLRERAEAACNTALKLSEHGLDIKPTKEDKDVAAKLAISYARVRIRALELLGKISDVGLFAEKSEVTITHQSTDDLRNKLRSKLAKIIDAEEIDDAIIIDGEVTDVDTALELKEEKDASE